METWQIILGVGVLAAVIALLLWFLRDRFGFLVTSTTIWWIEQNGFSIWEYGRDTWRMIEDHSKPGYVPGPAPAQAGTFAGERATVISVSRAEAR
jgi:hypothetical protein